MARNIKVRAVGERGGGGEGGRRFINRPSGGGRWKPPQDVFPLSFTMQNPHLSASPGLIVQHHQQASKAATTLYQSELEPFEKVRRSSERAAV